LPWPADATGINGQIKDLDLAEWNSGQTKTSISFLQTKGATIVKLRPADPKSIFGVDGTFTVDYNVPDAGKHKAAAGSPPSKHVDREGPEQSLAEKIADPATRAKFVAAANNLPAAPARTPSKVNAEATVVSVERTPGAASRGEITRTRVVVDPIRQQRDTQITEIVKTYQTDLKNKVPEEPAEPTGPKKQPPWAQGSSK
jgi:hypothetical protein